MKCAFIVPSWFPEEIFSSKTAGSQINYWQPLGTLYVAACLQKAGHEVIFLNGTFIAQSEILKKIEDYQPDFAGIYSTAFGWDKALSTASSVKKINPKIFVTAGGPYPVAMQEKCLLDSHDLDAVVTGEGERTTVELLAQLANGHELSKVNGLAYRSDFFEKTKGKIIKNPAMPLITELDSLPFPARELLGNPNDYIPPPATYKKKPVAVMITSRGCNRKCIYCFQLDKTRKSGIRYRSVGNVIKEIEYCLKQGYREIKFIDDTLAADYDRAMELAREIKRRKLKFTWFASACVNQVDLTLLRAFKEAGCWAILFGAESGVQKNLKTIRKGITPEKTRLAVRAAKKAGLTVITPFMFGIPGETFEEGLATIDFAMSLGSDIANFHAITPFPGTELYDNVGKYGSLSDKLTDYTYQGAAFIPYSMTRDQIAQLRQIAFKKFYSRPGYLIKRFFAIRSWNDLLASWKGLKSLFWLWAKKDIFQRK
jgi:radical SAM superfamily enzyme YgiQ (UPF0313 family)